MATITKTFIENYASTNKATWTVSLTQSNVIASGAVFEITPTMKAKYTASNKGYASVHVVVDFYRDSTDIEDIWFEKSPDSYAKWASGTEYTIPKTDQSSITCNTSAWFNSSNKTIKTKNIIAKTIAGKMYLETTSDSSGSTNYNEYANGSLYTWGTVATVTLNVPPTVTLGTPTYTTPHYTGFGTYSVPITSAEAYYGGDITKVTLAIGPNTAEQTYSGTSISDEIISLTPTIAGTYTPTLTVTDSRGQTTTTTLPQITVNSYNLPSLDFDVFRSDNNGLKDDEGTYGLVTANIIFTDAIASITEPTVQINGTTTSNVTWYSAYNSSTGVSSAISDWSIVSSGDTIYGLINGSFSQTDSYQITITLEDSLGSESSAISQTLSTAFYTIDFQAGGKEISFGGPANDNLTSYPNGLFKCGMDAQFIGDVTHDGDVVANGNITAHGDNTFTTGDTEIENPYYSLDTTASPGTTDGDLYAAITALSWENDVIV